MRTTRTHQRAAPMFDSCAVVPDRLTEELAHNILHIHSGCPTEQCPRRKAALFFLVEHHRRGPRHPR